MELILDEGRVSGARYYTAKPEVNWDFANALATGRLQGGVETWHDMENWCIKTFGDTPKDGVWTPNARWYMNNSKFWFREKKDLEWFVLKWT